ncbi:MAG TPA: PHP domain-containing protein [Anaerolineae bacterium]|nr:PHP domain-containing protein [Anaerolineae bacterium]
MNLSTTGLHLAADAAIDLHLHTVYSDGRWTPEALLDHLRQEHFALAAITDHDRVDTAAATQRLAREKGLPVIVGAELSSAWKGELVDLLCFGFDPDQNALSDLAQDLLRRQQEITRRAYEYVQQQGLALPPDDLPPLLDKPSAEQLHALIACVEAQGHDLGDPAVLKILRDSGITFATNEPAAIVAAAHQSGAVCLLAHPGHKDGFVTYDEPLLDEFRQIAPIDGLEVYHPLHTPDQTELYREYARRHHLLVSAGSDSHKPEKPPIPYPADLCRDLLERLGIQVA